VNSTTDSTSTTTGAVIVSGGLGVAKALYAVGVTSSGAIRVTDSTASTSTTTGSLTVVGGLGVGKALYAVGVTSSGAIRVTDSTDSTSTTTGALTVAGGVGIAGSLYVGARATANVITTANGISFGAGSASMPAPTGNAPMFAARAWAIATNSSTYSGGNIQSYSYNATPVSSEHTFTFATGFADGNYSVVPFVHRAGTNSDAIATVKSRGTTNVTIAVVNRDNSRLDWSNNLSGVGFTLFY
jgi:hypothetical protein